MHPCLVKICEEFETLRGFLPTPTPKQEKLASKLFFEFLDCFSSLKEEKLEYPKEFSHDVRLYLEGNKKLVEKFEDITIRYLMLSDFYDYVRLTKRYKRA
ncbi:MAG TPA: hypothetical protein ENK87_02215 [Nitratifractor sp.]|jgi:hypothetical protein|nr:hypothetical protein [Nitratifractor sp.]HHH20719.1 hypothetical protein [Nitratifractor sp.]